MKMLVTMFLLSIGFSAVADDSLYYNYCIKADSRVQNLTGVCRCIDRNIQAGNFREGLVQEFLSYQRRTSQMSSVEFADAIGNGSLVVSDELTLFLEVERNLAMGCVENLDYDGNDGRDISSVKKPSQSKRKKKKSK